MTPKSAKLTEDIDSVALRFTDLCGKIREIRIPVEMLNVVMEDGMSFDSSNLGFTDVSQSDMVAVPDPESMRIIEYENERIACFTCELYWPDGNLFQGCPRNLLKKTLNVMKEKGYSFRIKPEYEFHILDPETLEPVDDGRYIDGRSQSMFFLNIISQAVRKNKISVEKIHHEVGRGQYEIEPLPYDDPLKAADDFIFIKELVKKSAEELGLLATFMPKPIENEPGNGMHVHISVLKDGEFLFSPAELNEKAKGFIGGILRHAEALTAICCPTVNSYKRLVPGYEAPVYISWGGENRSVLVRIPAYGSEESEHGRVEFRAMDASGNFYLMLNSLITIGMDGLNKGLEPGEEIIEDLFELDLEEIQSRDIKVLPSTLGEALICLEKDELVRSSMGEAYPYYLKLKKREVDEYRKVVTDWEMYNYLEY